MTDNITDIPRQSPLENSWLQAKSKSYDSPRQFPLDITWQKKKGDDDRDYTLYGFVIDNNESDPYASISYIEDNKYFTPAKMNFTTGEFEYGSWTDAWFIKGLKPCMLKYDGTVGYLLDPNDYTKKLDGTASDISNTSYGGNAMVGIPLVYYKISHNETTNLTTVLVSDKQVDDDFKCWSHIDINGDVIPYFYIAIYSHSYINPRYRSLSNNIYGASSLSSELTRAKANNPSNKDIWNIDTYANRLLFQILLLLMGKSRNSQARFGYSRCSSGGDSMSASYNGTANAKGLFWGNNANNTDLKLFGIENYWGARSGRVAGLLYQNHIYKVKLTEGMYDGSTTANYNDTGSGYIAMPFESNTTAASGGYINTMNISEYGFFPNTRTGSSSTYWCDYANGGTTDTGLRCPAMGMSNVGTSNTQQGGIFSMHNNATPTNTGTAIGTFISCRPLAGTE
ncbi:hypothetical protein [Konateibacter massiliensis]|uniref:hypothetical protein n=1 Tax=Konateibacter massiliensis TaxID=2002841 RepID=UPI000C15228C|nr:hypothetical protein [Konateibacter massiliensis]